MHNHKHDHCQHTNMGYCSECNVAFCRNCGKEWGQRNWYYRYNPYWANITYTAEDGNTGTHPNITTINNSDSMHVHA